eukprot:Lankesteria_metandrocarpae@DN1383_c0_g1_i1.p1
MSKVAHFKRCCINRSLSHEDWRTLAVEMTEALISHASAGMFIYPVDAEAVPEYYQTVAQPMWFQKIAENLKQKRYSTLEEWKVDVFLVFRNCRTFNKQDSTIIQDCDRLQQDLYDMLRHAEKLVFSKSANAQTTTSVPAPSSVIGAPRGRGSTLADRTNHFG